MGEQHTVLRLNTSCVDTEGLKVLLFTCFFHYLYATCVKHFFWNKCWEWHLQLTLQSIVLPALKISQLAKEASGSHLWNCRPINGVKRCLCYITSVNFKQRSRRSLWHLHHISSLTKDGFSEQVETSAVHLWPLCQSVMEWRADTSASSHTYRYTDILCLFTFLTLSVSFCLSLVQWLWL